MKKKKGNIAPYKFSVIRDGEITGGTVFIRHHTAKGHASGSNGKGGQKGADPHFLAYAGTNSYDMLQAQREPYLYDVSRKRLTNQEIYIKANEAISRLSKSNSLEAAKLVAQIQDSTPNELRGLLEDNFSEFNGGRSIKLEGYGPNY